MDAAGGELRAEVLDAEGKVIPPYTRENCAPVQSDGTIEAVRWKGAADLAPVGRKPVRLRFTLRGGRLFSFWVSPEADGRSNGYVAAGGPGYTGVTDTVGAGALSGK